MWLMATVLDSAGLRGHANSLAQPFTIWPLCPFLSSFSTAYTSTAWLSIKLLAFLYTCTRSFMLFLLLEYRFPLYLLNKVPTQFSRLSWSTFPSLTPSCTSSGWIRIPPLGPQQGHCTTPGGTSYTGVCKWHRLDVYSHSICSPHVGQSSNLFYTCNIFIQFIHSFVRHWAWHACNCSLLFLCLTPVCSVNPCRQWSCIPKTWLGAWHIIETQISVFAVY